MKTYRVNDTIGIGQRTLEPGDVITKGDLQGADVQRLLDLGAIAVNDPSVEAAKDLAVQLKEVQMQSQGYQNALTQAQTDLATAVAERDAARSVLAMATDEERSELDKRLADSKKPEEDAAADKPKK